MRSGAGRSGAGQGEVKVGHVAREIQRAGSGKKVRVGEMGQNRDQVVGDDGKMWRICQNVWNQLELDIRLKTGPPLVRGTHSSLAPTSS